MRNQDTDKALRKIRAAYLRAQVITAMDAQWDSILTLNEEPYEALYKFCDLELGISPDSLGGGVLAALNNEALFVALTRAGVRTAPVLEFAQPRDIRRPEAPVLLGLVNPAKLRVHPTTLSVLGGVRARGGSSFAV
jgi:hypothetical protein